MRFWDQNHQICVRCQIDCCFHKKKEEKRWRHGTSSAAARCGAPPIPLSTRPRLCDQLQHSGTLRGADVITDHGAEHVVIVERIPASLIPQLVVSIFSSIHTFLCFSRESFVRSARKTKGEKKKKKEKCLLGLFGIPLSKRRAEKKRKT